MKNPTSRYLTPLVVCLLALAPVRFAGAQVIESVGARAQGMAGAFVAVADDVTATYWNPAGLANGPFAEATLQRSSLRSPFDLAGSLPADLGTRASTTFFAFAIPSLGVSVVRGVTVSALPPTAGAADGRQHDRPGVAVVSRLATTTIGGTLVQSLTANLVVGTTLKAVRGAFAASVTGAGDLAGALDEASRLDASSATRFDLDASVLGWAGPVRVGLVARNLRRPRFSVGEDDEGAPWAVGRLERQVRVGFAVTPGFAVSRSVAARPSLTVSLDADLTRTRFATGDERHVAVGIERWVARGRFGVRGGARVNTVGDRRPVVTGGASLGLRSGPTLEAMVGRGRPTDRGPAGGFTWSVSARYSF